MKLNEKRIVNDIRLLALDMINAAGSGHPGIALDAAPTLYTLFAYHLKFDLERKAWCNRDRFVLSAGHGSALLYSTLYYLLDEFNLEELKNFRKINSQCTGHPEYNLNNRIEVTTGPLGEGFATSVGLAIGEKYLESTFNKKKNIVFDYKIYTLVSDGDLMEGISYEAASLAGNLGLDNLIVLYDSNGVTADGDLDKAMYENIPDRFASMNWEVIKVKDGENIGEISNAIEKAKKSKKPVLIEIKTTLGIYSKYEGTNRIHSNLDKEDLEEIRTKLKGGPAFTYSENDRNNAMKFIKDGTEDYYRDWYSEYEMYIANATDSERDKINLVIENEKGFSGYLVAIYDPSKIKVTYSKNLGYSGEYLVDMAKRENAVVAINGGGFLDKDGQGTGGQAIGAIISNGKIISNYSHSQYGGGIIGFTNDNKLYLGKISAEEAINMGIRDAVEFGPFLIVNGKSAFINGNGGYGIHPRSAIAQRKDGIVLFLVIDGRSLKSKGADMNDLVDILLRYHAYNASNLDGGNSSALVIDNKIVNHPINWDNLEQTRPIPCGFIVKE